MVHWHVRKFTPVCAVALLLCGCETPDSIAKFSASAVATLHSGDPIFDDMKSSCVRDQQTREPLGAFSTSDAHFDECETIGKRAAELKASSGIVASYFSALNELASFGTAKTGEKARELVDLTSLDDAKKKAVASIAGFLTRVATTGYQQKQLADDIVRVHADIHVVLDGLGEAAGVVYVHQLQNEEQKTANRYKEFTLTHQSPDSLLTLDARWRSERAGFDSKRNAASSFQAALRTLAKANDDLASHAHSLRAKDLRGLLTPYAAELESVAGGIQKAFF